MCSSCMRTVSVALFLILAAKRPACLSCLPPFRTNDMPPALHPHQKKKSACFFTIVKERGGCRQKSRTFLSSFLFPGGCGGKCLSSRLDSIPRGVLATSALPPTPHMSLLPRYFPPVNPTTPTCIIDGSVMAPVKTRQQPRGCFSNCESRARSEDRVHSGLVMDRFESQHRVIFLLIAGDFSAAQPQPSLKNSECGADLWISFCLFIHSERRLAPISK